MSDIYDYGLETIENSLAKEIYHQYLIQLRAIYDEKYIAITEIDGKNPDLEQYYFEQILLIPLPENNQTLIEMLYLNKDIDSEVFKLFMTARYSIFKIKKVKTDQIKIVDLFQMDGEFPIDLSTHKGIKKGELFQGVIYKKNDIFILSQGVIFHPKDTHKYIEKNIKKDQDRIKNQDLILRTYFRNYINSKRYPNKKPLEIYQMNL